MRRGAEYILGVRPLSAYVAALLVIALAAALQEVLVLFGLTQYFATFFPAILITSLLGGAAAGAFAAVLTIPIVWWAFMPPYFEFNPLTAEDYDQIAVFLLCSSLLICLSQLYREALALSRKTAGRSPSPSGGRNG
jgi:K+-sensing histidine kinase KdpD